MKKIILVISFLLVAFSFIACHDDGEGVLNENGSTTWLLYETGYSPGGGYVTNEVASDPAQTITFHADSTFSSTIPGYTDYKFYRQKDDVILIYKLDKSIPTTNPSQSVLNYSFTIEGNDLRLYYRWCIEGCHMAFRRMEN